MCVMTMMMMTTIAIDPDMWVDEGLCEKTQAVVLLQLLWESTHVVVLSSLSSKSWNKSKSNFESFSQRSTENTTWKVNFDFRAQHHLNAPTLLFFWTMSWLVDGADLSSRSEGDKMYVWSFAPSNISFRKRSFDDLDVFSVRFKSKQSPSQPYIHSPWLFWHTRWLIDFMYMRMWEGRQNRHTFYCCLVWRGETWNEWWGFLAEDMPCVSDVFDGKNGRVKVRRVEGEWPRGFI